MEAPPLGPGGEDITWPNQVAPRGRKASSTREIKPQTSNLYPNPPFSNILRTLVNVHVHQATVALVIPEGKKWEEKERLWGPILEKLTVTKLLLPDVPLYQLNPKEEVLPKPCWLTAMYLVSGKNVSSNPM